MIQMVSERIHPTALVGPEVELAEDVQVGPYVILEGRVVIGSGCVIESHACIEGPVIMGSNNRIGHGAVIGKPAQTRSGSREGTSVWIGDDNEIREYVTIHRGTAEGYGVTRIGHRNLMMVNAHVGHDAQVGNGCTLVNNALVAGHVQLFDSCVLSGHSAVQQRARVGRLAMLGGMGASTRDVPPFVLQQGYNCVTGLNLIGMRRAGFTARAIEGVRCAFRRLYKENRSLQAALSLIETEHAEVAEVAEFVTFIRESRVGINPARDGTRQSWSL